LSKTGLRFPTSYSGCDAMGRDCFGLPQGTGLVRAQRMDVLLWVAVSLVGADRLAHARNRTLKHTPLPSSCSSSPRFTTEPRTQLLHAADPHTTPSAAVVVTTARDGCHALARPMNHAAARLALPGGGVMTSFLIIESPDEHYQTKPATSCTLRSRQHGHSKASARAIRAGRDITAQGGWRCACLHMSDSVPALFLSSNSLNASLAYCVPPLLTIDRTSTASGYSTARATSSRARWISHATAKHSTLASPVAFFYFQLTQGASRFHPRNGARLPPLSQPTDAELFLPQLLLPATRRAQWALHITSTRSFLLPLSQPTAAELLQTQLLLPAIRRARWALHVASTRCFLLPLSQPTAAELLQTQLVLPAIRRARWALHVASTRSSRPSYAVVHPYYATLGCRETRAALVTGPSSGRGGG
jgi:hypothetical protein